MVNKAFSLILTCYNERGVFDESVRFIIKILRSSNLSFEIIFVDDGSKDGTRKKILNTCHRYNFCHYVFHEHNLGRGAAVTSGIMKARSDIVGFIDIDCEVSPVYIPYAVSLIKDKKADLVIGKRIYITSIKSIIRSLASHGYRLISDLFLHTGGIDTESGYKFFRRKKFLPVLLRIDNKRWFWDTESIVFAKQKGLSIMETPVLFIRRFDKKSSVRLVHDTLDYLKNTWRLFWRLKNLK